MPGRGTDKTVNDTDKTVNGTDKTVNGTHLLVVSEVGSVQLGDRLAKRPASDHTMNYEGCVRPKFWGVTCLTFGPVGSQRGGKRSSRRSIRQASRLGPHGGLQAFRSP